jgi:hypothetical protein
MESTKKQAIAIVLTVFALVLLLFTFGSMMLRCTKEPFVVSKTDDDVMDCDSLRNEYLQVYIAYTRDEIILDRLYERDTVLYNELVANLE